MKEIFEEIQRDALAVLAKAMATIVAIAILGVLVGTLFENFGPAERTQAVNVPR